MQCWIVRKKLLEIEVFTIVRKKFRGIVLTLNDEIKIILLHILQTGDCGEEEQLFLFIYLS